MSLGAAVDVSVVIVSWNTRELTLACLASLAGAAGSLGWDAWVIDNKSTDGLSAWKHVLS
jgi:GT2 family glycosyltransferase